MKLKKLIALGLAAVMTLATVACGNTEVKTSEKESTPVVESTATESTPATSESKVEEKTDWSDTTLRVAWWGGDARNTYTTQVLENFANELYPGLNIEVEYAGFGDYFTKLTTQATANTLPDVFMMDMGKIDMFAEGNTMADLTPFIESGAIDTTNIASGALESGVVDGKLCALSTGNNGYAFFYDPAIAEEAGVTLEIQPKWSDFLEAAETVYEKTGKKVLISTDSDKLIDAYFRSLGRSLYSEDKKAYGFTGAEFAEWCEFMYDIQQEEYVVNAVMFEGGDHFTELQDANPYWTMLGNENTNNLNSWEKGSGKEIHMVSYPIADEATTTGTFLKAAMLWAIAEKSEQQDIAAAFLNYYSNTNSVFDLAGLDRGVPISSAVSEYLASVAAPADARGIEMINTIASEGMAGPGVVTAVGEAEAKTHLYGVLEQIAYGQIAKEDIAAAAEAAVATANDILAANN